MVALRCTCTNNITQLPPTPPIFTPGKHCPRLPQEAATSAAASLCKRFATVRQRPPRGDAVGHAHQQPGDGVHMASEAILAQAATQGGGAGEALPSGNGGGGALPVPPPLQVLGTCIWELCAWRDAVAREEDEGTFSFLSR